MRMPRPTLLAWALPILALMLSAAPAQEAETDMRDVIARFETDRSTLRRFWGVPMSTLSRERLGRFHEEWLEVLAGLDFDALDRAGRIDYILLENEIRSALAELVHESERDAEISALVPFREAIVTFEQSRRQREHVEPEEAADSVAAITQAVKEVSKDLEDRIGPKAEAEGKPSKSVAWRAAERTGALRRTLDGWYAYRAGYDPLFTWWVEAPYQEAKKALDDYARFLRRKVAGVAEGEEDPIIGDPIGRQALLDLLRHEMIPYTPEELVAIAEREFAWCETEMRRAAAEMGLGDDQAAALERVKADHVPPGGQDALIEELALEAIAFIDERDLVTIPDLCRETWRIEMLSPKSQKTSPFFNYGGHMADYPKPMLARSGGKVSNAMLGRSYVVEDRELLTAQDLYSGKELGAKLRKKIEAFVGA